ncbi:MAG: hypothetical protein ACHQD9_03280, partial [Chitinophagales bacterium]
PWTGFKFRIGLNSAFQFQDLNHQNTVDTNQFTGNQTGWNLIDANKDKVDDRQLVSLSNGFNLAMANLNLDAQLYDGVHMNLVAYLSSRHHQECWVKGGFIQFDKLTFLKSDAINDIMQYFTIKFGDYEVNYGDQHYRRSDGGNTMYNPFVENLVMDEFTTEIGGELQGHYNGFIGVFEMTGGEIQGNVTKSTTIDAVDSTYNKRAPSIIGKLGYDKQVNNDLRVRLTGSVYTTKSSASNTIFGGDRTGSKYFGVLENTAFSSTANAFSGRFNPGFSDQVTTYMINPFVKFHGLELFGTLEWANGRKVNEITKRDASQYAVDVIYRFPANQHFFVAGRYNTVTAQPYLTDPTGALWVSDGGSVPNVTINRYVFSAGWYILDQIMLKAEYVNQDYKNFPTFDIRNSGKFNGVMIEASLGF